MVIEVGEEVDALPDARGRSGAGAGGSRTPLFRPSITQVRRMSPRFTKVAATLKMPERSRPWAVD
jgi:hypothetical protein